MTWRPERAVEITAGGELNRHFWTALFLTGDGCIRICGASNPERGSRFAARVRDVRSGH